MALIMQTINYILLPILLLSIIHAQLNNQCDSSITISCLLPLSCYNTHKCLSTLTTGDITCSGYNSCQSSTFDCYNYRSCDIYCNGDNSCQSSTFNCPLYADCTFHCKGSNTCDSLTVNGPNSRIEYIYPTPSPTAQPVNNPSNTPTYIPTISPTYNPSETPTINPTNAPTKTPTNNPSQTPTYIPSKAPTKTRKPTISPTYNPSKTPSINPTNTPTYIPTKSPTIKPTINPTQNPLRESENSIKTTSQGRLQNGNGSGTDTNGLWTILGPIIGLLAGFIICGLIMLVYKLKRRKQLAGHIHNNKQHMEMNNRINMVMMNSNSDKMQLSVDQVTIKSVSTDHENVVDNIVTPRSVNDEFVVESDGDDNVNATKEKQAMLHLGDGEFIVQDDGESENDITNNAMDHLNQEGV